MDDLFKLASMKRFRYPSTIGDLSTEELWQLPLTSQRGASLDNTAQAINRELKAMSEESFVSTSRNPHKSVLENMLEVVKVVIADKQEANEKARNAAEKAEERQRLLEILDQKNDEELKGMSREELTKRLKELES